MSYPIYIMSDSRISSHTGKYFDVTQDGCNSVGPQRAVWDHKYKWGQAPHTNFPPAQQHPFAGTLATLPTST